MEISLKDFILGAGGKYVNPNLDGQTVWPGCCEE
jgi:hypothetical protein